MRRDFGVCQYFGEASTGQCNARASGPGQVGSKVGRNDPYSYGSGQKNKRCFGGATVN